MDSDRKRILWLASWYPNRYDPFDGDFIQRHARAAALYDDIHVLVVKEGEELQKVETDWNTSAGLTEQIIYFPSRAGWLSRMTKQASWLKIYLDAVKDHIAKFGKPELVHVHVPWKAGLIAQSVKKKYGVQFVITEHWTIYNDGKPSSFERWTAIEKRLLKWIFGSSLLTITVSRNLGHVLKSIFSIKHVYVINNAVDTTLFNYKPKKVDGEFHFIHVSTLTGQKNINGLISAFIQFKKRSNWPCKLSIVGPHSKGLEEFVQNNQDAKDSIFLLGLKTYPEVSELVKGADCMVLFSNYENSPCVILEALCCGIPVIATNVGGINELIDFSNGILVNPNRIEELVHSMKQIKQNYKQYDKEAIAKTAQIKFNYKAIGQEFNKIYSSF